jgi:hypothetical protein
MRRFEERMSTAHAQIYRQRKSGGVSSRLDQKQIRAATVPMPHQTESSL